MSRIFTNVDETHTLLTNLYKSLCRSDQETWLRQMNLSRIGGYGSMAVTATTNNGGSPRSVDFTDVPVVQGGSQANLLNGTSSSANNADDDKPSRGFSNVAALIAEARSPARGVGSPSKKFDVGNQPRISQALRLAGESHTIEDETMRNPVINVDTGRGTAAHKGEMKCWFDELLEKQQGNNNNTQEEEQKQQQVVSIETAKAEYLCQEHFGSPRPDQEFDRAVEKYAPIADQRGGLIVDEFAIIFGRFDYD